MAYIGLIGIFIIGIVIADVFQAVVVPRRTPRTFKVSSWLIRTLWVPWRQLSLRATKRREYLLGIFAPLSLMLLLTVWVVALIVGFGLICMPYARQFNLRSKIMRVPFIWQEHRSLHSDLGIMLLLALLVWLS